jgi:hypothetical protein
VSLRDTTRDEFLEQSVVTSSVQEGEGLTREQRRSRRKRAVRARTISVKRLSKKDLARSREPIDSALFTDRPQARSKCVAGPRPCPYVGCRYHLYLDVSRRTGSIKLNFPDLEVWELAVSCALDVADDGAATLEDVGAIMNVTRERIRQLEIDALARLAMLRDMRELRDLPETEESSPRAARRDGAGSSKKSLY